MTAIAPSATHPALRARWRDQRGIQLVELLIGVVIVGFTATVALSVLVSVGVLATGSTASTRTFAQLQDGTGQILRDVTDASRLVLAEPHALTVEVQRDSRCTRRSWSVENDRDLVVVTDTYTGVRCTGGFESSSTRVVQGTLTGAEFGFFSSLSQGESLPTPVPFADVTRVAWELRAMPAFDGARELTITSGAALTQRVHSDGAGAVQDALAPLLEIVYDPDVPNTRIGVDAPVLRWTDRTPELTTGWVVYRASAEGDGPSGRTTWQAVMRLGPAADTWIDVSLGDGATGQWVVVATLDGARTGPSSNQVSSGLRPATPTLTATGLQAGIGLSWSRTPGADGWDVYRDGALTYRWSEIEDEAAFTDDTVTWVDPTGAGAAFTYEVVATSRWERAATVTSAQGARAPNAQRHVLEAGTSVDAELGAPGLTARRLTSEPASAWSAPVAPIGLTIANRQPADPANLASTWDATVDLRWTASAWTGGYADAARAATRYAVTRGGTSIRTGLTSVSTTDTGAPRGTTSGYVVTASTVAPHSLTGAASMGTLLTWPSAPTCTATAGGGGHPATRAATVTVSGPAGQTVSARRQRIASGEVRAAASSAWITLTHGTPYAWRGQAQNAAGWSPWSGECGISTAVLTVTPPPTPSCWATSAPQYAPGSIHWGVSTDATLTSPSTTYASGAGTYRCAASRTNTNSDGFNTVSSTRTGSGSVYVDAYPYPSAWGDRAGCPAVGIYVTPSSPTTFNVRRIDAVNCQARLVLTQAGADADPLGTGKPGDVRAMYATTVGGSVWTRVSGTGPATAPAV